MTANDKQPMKLIKKTNQTTCNDKQPIKLKK